MESATVGGLINAACRISSARRESLDAYTKAFRRIVSEIKGIKSDRKHDFHGGGVAEWQRMVDAVSLATITPAEVVAWKNRRLREPPGSVSKERSLAFSADDFHPFWQTHGKGYLRQHKAAEEQRKLAAEKNREVAGKGAPKRDHTKWIGHTESFITFLKNTGNCKNPETIQNAVTTYAKDHSGLKDKGAKAKLEVFLGTLCNSTGGDWDASTIRSVLQKSGVKACAETTIDVCRCLLNTALDRDRGKM